MEAYFACESTKRIAQIVELPKGELVRCVLFVYQVEFSRFANEVIRVSHWRMAMCNCGDEHEAYSMMTNFGLAWKSFDTFDEAENDIAILATLPEVV